MMEKTEKKMELLVDIAKALSDSNRVRALAALQHGELCVCQLIELLKLAPSTVSKHMSILKQAGLVESRKDSRWVYYRLPEQGVHLLADRIIDLTQTYIENDLRILRDKNELLHIRSSGNIPLCNVKYSGMVKGDCCE